jgi:hypothetical protein
MSRRVVLFLVLAVVVVLLGAAVGLVVSNKSALEDDRSAIDARWTTVRAPLAARYDALGQVGAALAGAGAQDRTYTKDLDAELGVWKQLAASGRPHPSAEAASANRLEGLATRVRVNVARSVRLTRDAGIAQAFSAFDGAVVPPPDIQRYNRAVQNYQDTRTDSLKRLAAKVLGFGPRPLLVVGAPPPTG